MVRLKMKENMKKIELFDFIRGMMQNKSDFDFSNPEVSSNYDIYWINRWLSMCDLFIPIVSELNRLNLPKEAHYNFLKDILPQKQVFLKYIKKVRDLSHEQKVTVAKHFNTNLKNAEPMIQLISDKELENIINIYKEEGDKK